MIFFDPCELMFSKSSFIWFFSSLADCLADNKLCSKPNHESYHSIHEMSFLVLRPNSLTFVDHSEVDLSNIAVKVWRVSHLAAVGAIKGWIHCPESDGSIFSHDISRPHYMPFELRRHWRVRRFVLVVKHLPHTLQKKTKKGSAEIENINTHWKL